MPPSPLAIQKAFRAASRLIQSTGEAARPGRIRLLPDGENEMPVAIWRNDPARSGLTMGGSEMPKRLVVTIDKARLASPFETGQLFLWVEEGTAWAVTVTGEGPPGETAWRFEAEPAPGSNV